MRWFRTVIVWALGVGCSATCSAAVSAYLPLNLEPELEVQVDEILLLADQPVLKRPISVAALRDAMQRICTPEIQACRIVESRLADLLDSGLSFRTSLEVAAGSSTSRALPNQLGVDMSSRWNLSTRLSWQPNEHWLLAAGATGQDGEVTPDGTMLSFGWKSVQFDLGYRPRAWSPLLDSSQLIGTQASTMPSATLSSNRPLTRAGFQYEFFVSEMSRSDQIAFQGRTTAGRPRLAGVHLSIEPVRGWSLGVNRLLQYGGGERGGQSLKDLFNAFVDPGRFDNANAGFLDNQFGNQLASVTSSFVFPGVRPVAVYFEYAGEDTSRGRAYLLGNAALSAGIHIPNLVRGVSAAFEFSEWQNGWYVNGLYGDGLTNRGRVIGHWAGDARVFGDDVGAQALMARLTGTTENGDQWLVRVRSLKNESYGRFSYRRAGELTFSYSRQVSHQLIAGGSLEVGRDIYGEDYGRVAAYLRHFSGGSTPARQSITSSGSRSERRNQAEWFIDIGAAQLRTSIDLDDQIPRFVRNDTGIHWALGARRAVTARQDLGVRIEVDTLQGNLLTAVRALDYRYRFNGPLALNAFVGAARFDLETPAYGLWFGAGATWRDIRPRWDLGLEARFGLKIARDDLTPRDPVGGRPDSFYDVQSIALQVSRKF